MTQMNAVTVFGEVLFDHFPDDHRVLGGAPFNVAWHLHAFDQRPHFISRIGHDHQGDDVLATMRNWGMDISSIQRDHHHPTGQVAVDIVDGEPHYDIVAEQAYDYIEAGLEPPTRGVLYHGSLALRHSISRSALENLKNHHRGQIFLDVNLRSPWWQVTDLVQWLSAADWVKLNLDEFQLLGGSRFHLAREMENFLKRYELEGLIVTLGEDGAHALTYHGEHQSVAPPHVDNVIDTVGAGDAFSAVALLGLLYQWPLRTLLDRAQSFASAVVQHRGATIADTGLYRHFKDQWQIGRRP